MTNIHITPGELIATGTIESELHYGPYLRDWWVFSKENHNHIPYPIPIRLGLKIMIHLNKIPFIIHVVRYIHSPLQPGYICEDGGQSSDIVTSSSQAITSVYQAVFGTKTKIAGLSYLDLEQTQTFQKLLEGVIFCPFIIEIENLSIFVGSLGKITHSNHNIVGHNYTSSFFYKYKAKQSVFFQSIKDDNLFSIVIYQNSQIVAEYKNNSPNTVWQQTGILKSILGDTLFAINHSIVLQKLDEAYNTKFSHQTLISDKCTLTDWNNKTIMRHLFDLYLKKAVYGSNYEFREREVRAWRAIFRATGCTEITPYDKQISKNEFWTNAPNPEKDRATLKNLYEEGMLNVSSQNLTIKTFWDCFRDSYDANFRGADGKVSPNTINAARKFSRINGPGCAALEKPTITRSKMSEVKEKEFKLFFNDKENVNMSSYKVDTNTNLPILYLKDLRTD
ncbi:4495_t:CDS:2 [Cetraspora pellucida]|uniref:4495_t:CDS:1 n=1 Tax=Cetraspora pellucida TaxID=1433469 RepID=A0ACA9NTK1_9GLOM|nr:4495_t:CDS:2 [Cetraspora pellucida]